MSWKSGVGRVLGRYGLARPQSEVALYPMIEWQKHQSPRVWTKVFEDGIALCSQVFEVGLRT